MYEKYIGAVFSDLESGQCISDFRRLKRIPQECIIILDTTYNFLRRTSYGGEGGGESAIISLDGLY